MAGRLETGATSSYLQQDSAWVERASWLYACYFDLKLTIYCSGLPTAFRYRLAQVFPLLFDIIISSPPLQQIMAPQTPPRDEHGTEISRTTGASSNVQPVETQLQSRHHLAHHDAPNTATESITLNTQLKIVCEIGSGKNVIQPAIGCEYSWIKVDDRELMV